MNLLFISIAPVIMILFYVYYRDKYEKEPINLLMKGLLLGCVIVIPIIVSEKWMTFWGSFLPDYKLLQAFYRAFFVAALCEETFKLIAVRVLIWRNPNFNEKFDGIVYAVFVSLGFALVENILYVFGSNDGMGVGLMRAITAVPAHAMFGIVMGYYLGLAKFNLHKSKVYSVLSFVVPFAMHGYYDYILMSEHPLLMLTFVPFLVWMYFSSNRRMRTLSEQSVFKWD